jgi:hypothetical protein
LNEARRSSGPWLAERAIRTTHYPKYTSTCVQPTALHLDWGGFAPSARSLPANHHTVCASLRASPCLRPNLQYRSSGARSRGVSGTPCSCARFVAWRVRRSGRCIVRPVCLLSTPGTGLPKSCQPNSQPAPVTPSNRHNPACQRAGVSVSVQRCMVTVSALLPDPGTQARGAAGKVGQCGLGGSVGAAVIRLVFQRRRSEALLRRQW